MEFRPAVRREHAGAGRGGRPLDISSSRVLLFDKAGVNINQALSVAVVPSCIQENLTQVKFWQECADEISTPRFNAGDGRVSGRGRDGVRPVHAHGGIEHPAQGPCEGL